MNLVIATPFYLVNGFSPYITSLMGSVKVLNELGIDYDFYELSGDSYVDRAKNSLVHKFLENDGTHLFMIDSDLSWDLKGFGRIIKAGLAGAEVVGGAYPNKNNWKTFGAIPLQDENGFLIGVDEKGFRVLEAWGIPGGFILYSREAFERTRPVLKTYKDVELDVEYLECFRCNIEPDGGRIGEDIYFQKRYRECGGKLWLEPNITFQHWGVKGWWGNYHKFLLGESVKEQSRFKEKEK